MTREKALEVDKALHKLEDLELAYDEIHAIDLLTSCDLIKLRNEILDLVQKHIDEQKEVLDKL